MGLARFAFLAKHALRDAASARALRAAAKGACALGAASLLMAVGCAATCASAWIARPPDGSAFYAELPGRSCPPSLVAGASAVALVAQGPSLRQAIISEAFHASCRMESGRPVALLVLRGGAASLRRSPLFQPWVASMLPEDASTQAASWTWKPVDPGAGWARASLEALGLAEAGPASRVFGSEQPPSGAALAWGLAWRSAAGLLLSLAVLLSTALTTLFGCVCASMIADSLRESMAPAKAWITRSDPASLSEAEARELAGACKRPKGRTPRGGRL